MVRTLRSLWIKHLGAMLHHRVVSIIRYFLIALTDIVETLINYYRYKISLQLRITPKVRTKLNDRCSSFIHSLNFITQSWALVKDYLRLNSLSFVNCMKCILRPGSFYGQFPLPMAQTGLAFVECHLYQLIQFGNIIVHYLTSKVKRGTIW